jgi:hypothetical protein
MKKSNLDRTYPNRRNSDFRGFFQGTKSEKFRFSAMNFALFLCCYCLILIKLLKGSSSKYRTRQFNINVNSGENRKNSDSLRRSGENRPRNAFASGKQREGGRCRIARLISFNPLEIKLLLYSGSGTRARRKTLKASLPLIRFLRSLDALIAMHKGASQSSPKCRGFKPHARRGSFCSPKEMFI